MATESIIGGRVSWIIIHRIAFEVLITWASLVVAGP